MGLLLNPLVLRGLLIVGLAIFLWGAWKEFTGHYINIGRAQVQALWDADAARRAKQVTDMANLWNEQRQKADAIEFVLNKERNERFQPIQQRAAELPAAVANVRIPALAVGVLDDAIRNTAATAGPAGKPSATAAGPAASPEGGESTVGLITGWGVEVVRLYDECRARVGAWSSFYTSLRAAQPKEGTP